MARRRNDLTPEELALIKAQTAAIPAQTAQAAADTMAKQRIAMQQLEAERAINAEKTGLGREEITGRNQQAQLAAAMGLLDTGAKERIARLGEQGNIASDIAKDTTIPANIRATALAESGQPGLYNALEADKAAKRDEYIKSEIPAILKARDDVEREKIIKPRMELAFPGSFEVGRARAYPKAENESARAASQAKKFEGTPTETVPGAGGADYSELIGTLLGKSGVTPTASANVAPPAPETRYVPQGAGSLEGSTRVPGGIQTPSGGFIGGTLGEDRLAKLITPKGDITSTANANVNGAPSGETPIPALNLPITTQSLPSTVPLITQAPASYEQLLASNAPGPKPPDINLDAMLSNLVGQPSMEDLKRRQQTVRY